MTEAEFLRLPKADQAALFAVHQQEWQQQGAPVCTPDRSDESTARVIAWADSICEQSLARPEVEGKQAASDEERQSLRDDSWK